MKEVILRNIKSVRLAFSPVCPKSASIRTLLNRISTRKFDSDNPNCIVEKHVSSSTTSPQAHITFRDDKVVTFSTEKIAFDDLVGRISKHCNRLDMKA